MGNSLGLLKKLNTELYDPATSLLGIYLKEFKAGTQTDKYTKMSIAALFTTAKSVHQSKCPSADE